MNIGDRVLGKHGFVGTILTTRKLQMFDGSDMELQDYCMVIWDDRQDLLPNDKVTSYYTGWCTRLGQLTIEELMTHWSSDLREFGKEKLNAMEIEKATIVESSSSGTSD